MKLWLDAQLSPGLARRLSEELGVEATALRDLGLRDAADAAIFAAAKTAEAVVMTKDADFAQLVGRLGSPPQVLWVTLGNTSTPVLFDALAAAWAALTEALTRGEALVELTRPAAPSLPRRDD